jgi:hypothetical protein
MYVCIYVHTHILCVQMQHFLRFLSVVVVMVFLICSLHYFSFSSFFPLLLIPTFYEIGIFQTLDLIICLFVPKGGIEIDLKFHVCVELFSVFY